jgi:hypothetical protein
MVRNLCHYAHLAAERSVECAPRSLPQDRTGLCPASTGLGHVGRSFRLLDALWTLFAAMLYVAEPLFLHRRMAMSQSPETDFDRMVVLHRLLSVAALFTISGAIAGAHGLI